jgi:hypothetical protein
LKEFNGPEMGFDHLLYSSLMLLRVLGFLALAFAALYADQAANDWPQFLGPTRNGVYAGADLAQTWPASGPPILWRKDVGEGFAAPVVAAGKLILFHRAGGKEIVDCFNALSGEKIWSYDYPTTYRDDFGFDEGPRSAPVIADGAVYTFGAQGVLTAVDLASGKKRWSVATNTQFGVKKGWFGAAGSPLVEDGKVLVHVGGPNAGIVAFDANTGAVAWKATSDEASYSSPTAATIGGARHAFFLTRTGLVDLDPANGQVRFGECGNAPGDRESGVCVGQLRHRSDSDPGERKRVQQGLVERRQHVQSLFDMRLSRRLFVRLSREAGGRAGTTMRATSYRQGDVERRRLRGGDCDAGWGSPLYFARKRRIGDGAGKAGRISSDGACQDFDQGCAGVSGVRRRARVCAR